MTKECDKELIIGIPRGMSFYGNYPFWHGFFNALGFNIKMVSGAEFTEALRQTARQSGMEHIFETFIYIKIIKDVLLLIVLTLHKSSFIPI